MAERLGLLLTGAVYLIPLLAAVRPVTDADLWCHLRAGQWLAVNQTLPMTDPVCQYCADKPWVLYSWLFEIPVYALYAALGLTGILLLRVVLCLAVVAGLHRLILHREPRFLVATLLTMACALAMLPLMTERPWLVTILFCLLTADVILGFREGRSLRRAWLLPLSYVIWANMHIQVVYGLMLLSLACVAPVLDRWLGLSRDDDSCRAGSPVWGRLVALSIVCGLATLINPYHVALYGVVLDFATHQAPQFLIRELQALEFRAAWEWLVLALALVSAFCIGRRRRLSSFDVLLLAAAAYFTFRSRRDVWMMSLAAAVLIPRGRIAAAEQQRGAQDAATYSLTQVRAATIAAGVLFLALLLVWAKGLTEDALRQEVAEVYPERAVAVIEERGYAGPLFNDFNWGSYLMWQLPRLKVSIDGRSNMHGDLRVQQSFDTWSALPGWGHDPELAAANLVIANRTTALAEHLRNDAHFRLVYEDKVALVFVRTKIHSK